MGKSLEDQKRDWNELEFISWKEFQQMAPAILQLEITRISRLLATQPFDADFHNALVAVRYQLKKFIEYLANVEKDGVETACAPHLNNALLNMPAPDTQPDPALHKTLDYIRDRINYVLQRIKRIY